MTSGTCQDCGNEYMNLEAHKRFCKGKKSLSQSSSAAPPIHNTPASLPEVGTPDILKNPPHEEPKKSVVRRVLVWIFGEKKEEQPDSKEKKMSWAYKIVSLLFFISGIIQYFIFDFFRINKWLLLVVYAVDLIIYIFLIWTIWRLRKKAEIVTFDTFEELIEAMPKWCLDEKAPNRGIIGSILNMGKKYKQIVLVSKHFEPEKLWLEWNGFQLSHSNKAYKPPYGSVPGDIWFYNIDKHTPLIDTVEVTPEDAEDSFQLDAVWNQGFAVGHAAAMSKTQGQIQLILILVAVGVGLQALVLIYLYGQFGQVHEEINALRFTLNSINQSINSNQVVVHG